MPRKKEKQSVLIFSAHSDDFVIGAGGTIAKLASEGYTIHAVVFSYGEMSHVWEEAKTVQEFRSKEAFDAAKTLGCSCEFFNLKEGKFLEQAEDKQIVQKLEKIIKKYKPQKIFTHSSEDPHPDHQSVHELTRRVQKILKIKPQILTYSIWNPVEFQTSHPALVVPTKKHFKQKLKALEQFPSQRFNAIYPLMFLIWFRDLRNGWKIKSWFAEKFYMVDKGNKEASQ